MILQHEGFGSSEKIRRKKGYIREKYEVVGDQVELETCYCSKNFCNTQYKLPEGTLFLDEEQSEDINGT